MHTDVTKAYGYTSYGGPETQDWFDRPDPTPAAADVLIRVKAAGVNPADWKIRNGWFADPNATPEFPQVLGTEACGVVEAVGEDVEGISAGDVVFGVCSAGVGSYAGTTLLVGAETAVKPGALREDWAAVVAIAGATGYDLVGSLDLPEGATVLINGIGGGVGVVAAQVARDRGFAVFGTGSADKRAMAESLGAVFVDYTAGSVVDQMRALLPGGVDAILDCAGQPSLGEVAVLVTNPGNIVSVADFEVGKLGGRLVERAHDRATLEAVAALMVEGKLDPKVTETYPFDQAPQALAAVEAGHTLGKVVIDLAATEEV